MTLKQPFFSIITVCRNEKKDIEDITIKNIINQTYKNFEWLVVDGGSTDGTVQILKRYQKHMAYFSSKKDRGIYHAMNQAIVKAKGQYLIFMNGGDGFVNTQVLAKTHRFINRDNHGHQLYFGESLLYDNNIKKYIKWHVFNGQNPNKRNMSSLFHYSLPHQASFFHHSLFQQYGLYDETYQFAADYDFYLKIAKRQQFAFMNFNVCFHNIAQYNNRMANKKIRSAELADLEKIRKKNFGVVYYWYKQSSKEKLSIKTLRVLKKILKLGIFIITLPLQLGLAMIIYVLVNMIRAIKNYCWRLQQKRYFRQNLHHLIYDIYLEFSWLHKLWRWFKKTFAVKSINRGKT